MQVHEILDGSNLPMLSMLADYDDLSGQETLRDCNIDLPYVIPKTIHTCSGLVTGFLFSGDEYKGLNNCPECQAAVYGHLGESKVPIKVLRHHALAPRLQMMYKSPYTASYMMMRDRLGKGDNEPSDDMPGLENPGILNVDDDIYGDMPSLETAKSVTAECVGLQSLVKCDPNCHLCIKIVPSDGVLVLDMHFTWLRSCFDSSVSLLVLHLLLQKFGISKTAFYELFRIILIVHAAQEFYSKER